MQRVKPEAGGSLSEMVMAEEDQRRQARIGVITSFAAFAAIVFSLRIGRSE